MNVKSLWSMRLLAQSTKNHLPRGAKLSKIQVEGPSEHQIAGLGKPQPGAAVPESEFQAAIASAVSVRDSSAPVFGVRK